MLLTNNIDKQTVANSNDCIQMKTEGLNSFSYADVLRDICVNDVIADKNVITKIMSNSTGLQHIG